MEFTQTLPISINQKSANQNIVPFQSQTHIPASTSHSNNKPTLKQDATTALLSQIFPEQNREDKSIKQARIILGSLLEKFSTDELQETVILLQYLTESWLDMYERELFDGMTLNELLNLG